MKKSFLWAFSLAICLVACFTACDNDSAVDESIMDSSATVKVPTAKSGTVDLFDSLGNKIGTAPYEFTYQYQDTATHSTRGGFDDAFYFNIAPQNIIFTRISNNGSYTVFKGYMVITTWGKIALGNPNNYEEYYVSDAKYPKKKGYKMRFECIVKPFSMELTIWGGSYKLFTMYVRNDYRFLGKPINTFMLSQNLACGSVPKALQQFKPVVLHQLFVEMTDYEDGEPLNYKGLVYY